MIECKYCFRVMVDDYKSWTRCPYCERSSSLVSDWWKDREAKKEEPQKHEPKEA